MTEAAVEAPPRQCPHCEFVAKDERGLSVHVAHKHKDVQEPAFEDRPQRTAPPPPSEPTREVKAETIRSQAELDRIGKALAENIETCGQILHAGLYFLKVRSIAETGRPKVNTHLAFAVQLRAEMTAAVLMGYAKTNEMLMKFVLGFNSAFSGGEVGAVIGSLAVAAAATACIEAPIMEPAERMLIPDVVAKVEAEDRKIRAQFQMAMAQANGHQDG